MRAWRMSCVDARTPAVKRRGTRLIGDGSGPRDPTGTTTGRSEGRRISALPRRLRLGSSDEDAELLEQGADGWRDGIQHRGELGVAPGAAEVALHQPDLA